MEILLAVSIGLTGVLLGYIATQGYWQRRLLVESQIKTDSLNKNLEAFAKAYADFTSRVSEIEGRFANLEFRMTGIGEKR